MSIFLKRKNIATDAPIGNSQLILRDHMVKRNFTERRPLSVFGIQRAKNKLIHILTELSMVQKWHPFISAYEANVETEYIDMLLSEYWYRLLVP